METVTFNSKMTPFFSLGESTRRERIASLRKAFNFIAGDDQELFTEYLLEKTQFGKLEIIPIIYKKMSLKFLENLKTLMQNTSKKHLPALRSLITSKYTLNELNELGFHINKNEYDYSKKIKKINKIHINKNEKKIKTLQKK